MASIRGPWAGRSTEPERASAVIVTWLVELAWDKVDAQVCPEQSGGHRRAGGGEQRDPPGLGDRARHLDPPMGAGELVLQAAATQW